MDSTFLFVVPQGEKTSITFIKENQRTVHKLEVSCSRLANFAYGENWSLQPPHLPPASSIYLLWGISVGCWSACDVGLSIKWVSHLLNVLPAFAVPTVFTLCCPNAWVMRGASQALSKHGIMNVDGVYFVNDLLVHMYAMWSAFQTHQAIGTEYAVGTGRVVPRRIILRMTTQKYVPIDWGLQPAKSG